MRKVILTALILMASLSSAACWETADEGTVKVQTIYGRVNGLVTPESGGVWTWNTLGDDYHEVNLRAKTMQINVRATTKDNAAVTVNVAATYSVQRPHAIEYARRYGLTEEERVTRRDPILTGVLNTATVNAITDYGAYELLANQENVRKKVEDLLRPEFEKNLVKLESIQLPDKPDFLDDRIEAAASGAVAAAQEKVAEAARLEAAQVKKQTKEVEAQVAAMQVNDPKLFQLKLLEQQTELERARAEGIARHNGPLTIIYGQNDRTYTQVQVPTGR